MAFTVIFALIGNEIKTLGADAGQPKESDPTVAGDVLTAGGRIILGGMVATSLLVLLTHAGNAGRQFAVGLAAVAMASSTLVYGGPVWSAMGTTFGSQPTGGTSSTTPTAPTTPDANTVDSTATIATAIAS
jgi:hypothetical protein